MKHFIGFIMSFGMLFLFWGIEIYNDIKRSVITKSIIFYFKGVIIIGIIALGCYLLAS